MKPLKLVILFVIIALLPVTPVSSQTFYCSNGDPCPPSCAHSKKPTPCPATLKRACCESRIQEFSQSNAIREIIKPIFAVHVVTLKPECFILPQKLAKHFEKTQQISIKDHSIFLQLCSFLI